MAYRVLFHLSECAGAKVEAALGNIRHLMEDLATEGLEVELVVHGDGIAAFYRSPNRQARAIEELAAQGVRFAVCHNSMAARGVTADDLLDAAQVVPSGTGELVRRQAEGWVYVRP